jgi:hypothetical protein
VCDFQRWVQKIISYAWFEEEYTKYYQWLTLFGSGLVVANLAFLGRKMVNQRSKLC